MSQPFLFEEEEFTFTLHYLDTNETETFDNEYDLKEIIEQISWEKHNWTPIMQEYIEDGEFTMFVHSCTYDDDVYSEKGEKAWQERGYDFNDDGDFWERFQEEFKIKVVTTPKGGESE